MKIWYKKILFIKILNNLFYLCCIIPDQLSCVYIQTHHNTNGKHVEINEISDSESFI